MMDHRGQPRRSEVSHFRSLKAVHIVFFDVQGLLIDHAVPTDTTVNRHYYAKFIRHHLRPATRKKRPDLLREGPIILHDKASPHMKRDVAQLLSEEYDWEVLRHPPYSPDRNALPW